MYTVYQVGNSCYPLHLDCSRCPPARRWAPGGRRGSRGCSPCCRHRTGPCNCHHHYYISCYYIIITLPVPDKVGEERLRPVPGAVPLVTRRPVVVSLQLGRLVTNTHLAINIFTTLKYFLSSYSKYFFSISVYFYYFLDNTHQVTAGLAAVPVAWVIATVAAAHVAHHVAGVEAAVAAHVAGVKAAVSAAHVAGVEAAIPAVAGIEAGVAAAVAGVEAAAEVAGDGGVLGEVVGAGAGGAAGEAALVAEGVAAAAHVGGGAALDQSEVSIEVT